MQRTARRRWAGMGAGAVLAALGVALLTTTVAAAVAPVAQRPEDASGLAGPAPGESLSRWTERWMEGPVRHIASKEERELYAELESTSERLQFIRLFWQRRDPQLRGPRNEFLDEFASRVEYANENFSNGKPGWETVFGRIVLAFGPPDRTRRELSVESDRPARAWIYDERLPEIPPNEVLIFVFRQGRWRLLPPSPIGDSGVDLARRQLEAQSNIVQIPGDFQRSIATAVEETWVNPVDYREAIETVRTVVAFEGFGEAEIPFAWEATSRPMEGGTVEVTLTLTWEMRALVFHRVEESFETSMVVDALLLDGEEPVAQASENFVIEVAEDELTDANVDNRVTRTMTLQAPPGSYELRLTLLDRLLGYRTAYRGELEVAGGGSDR